MPDRFIRRNELEVEFTRSSYGSVNAEDLETFVSDVIEGNIGIGEKEYRLNLGPHKPIAFT